MKVLIDGVRIPGVTRVLKDGDSMSVTFKGRRDDLETNDPLSFEFMAQGLSPIYWHIAEVEGMSVIGDMVTYRIGRVI